LMKEKEVVYEWQRVHLGCTRRRYRYFPPQVFVKLRPMTDGRGERITVDQARHACLW
jgi:hypothetical protein